MITTPIHEMRGIFVGTDPPPASFSPRRLRAPTAEGERHRGSSMRAVPDGRGIP